jgi:hypothetical protein
MNHMKIKTALLLALYLITSSVFSQTANITPSAMEN